MTLSRPYTYAACIDYMWETWTCSPLPPAMSLAQVTCLAICPELDLVLSGSADGAILMHTLGEGR